MKTNPGTQALTLLFLPAILAITVSCSSTDRIKDGQAEPESSDAPVTLSMLNWSGMTDQEFERYIVNTVAKKHPHITLTMVKKTAGKPQELIANYLMAEQFPDLIFVSNKDINEFLIAKTVYSLDDFVKSNNFDLKRFDPSAVASLQRSKEEGGLVAIPWSQNVAGLFYSKDVFDKFGVPYPKDLMTWDEAANLARTLTRKENDVQYVGLNVSSLSQFAQSLSVSYVSADGKALVDTPVWNRILQFYKTVFAVPGAATKATFFGTKTVAMQPEWLASTINSALKDPQFRWDVAGLPNVPELLGTGREIDAHSLAISAGSKHKKQAFQVIQAVTTNDVQAEMSQNGRVPILAGTEILSGFGSQVPYLADKNWDAMFKAAPGKPRDRITTNDSIVLGLINPLADRLRAGETDINTMLRETQEQADAALAAVQ